MIDPRNVVRVSGGRVAGGQERAARRVTAMVCPDCHGHGHLHAIVAAVIESGSCVLERPCSQCDGTGRQAGFEGRA